MSRYTKRRLRAAQRNARILAERVIAQETKLLEAEQLLNVSITLLQQLTNRPAMTAVTEEAMELIEAEATEPVTIVVCYWSTCDQPRVERVNWLPSVQWWSIDGTRCQRPARGWFLNFDLLRNACE